MNLDYRSHKIPGLKLINLEKFGLAATLVGAMTLVSRLIGLFRTRLMTGKFGAGETLDIYFASFRLPDLLMGVFVVGTLSLAILPVVMDYMVKRSGEAEKLISKLLNWVILGMAFLVALCLIFTPAIVRLFAPGFSGEVFAQTVLLTRVVLVAQLFLAPANLLAGVLNATRRFFWSSLAPIFYNLGLIVGVLWFYDVYGILGLGYGVMLGAVVHFFSLYLALWKTGFHWRVTIKVDAGVRQALKLYAPRLLMLDLTQVGLILATYFGSWLVAGSITVFNLGFDLQAVPVGVLGVASAIAVFPLLAEAFSKGRDEQYIGFLSEAAAKIIFYMAPVSVLMLLLRAHIVRLVYGVGNFNWDDTRGTFAVLGILAFSMVSQALVPLLSRAILARHLSWVPVLANLVGIVSMVLVAGLFGRTMGVNGVALAYVVGITLNAIFLYLYLRFLLSSMPKLQQQMLEAENWLSGQVWKMLVGLVVLSVSSYALLYAVAPLFDVETWLGLALQAGIAGGVGILLYFYSTLYFKVEEATKFYSWLFRKIENQHK